MKRENQEKGNEWGLAPTIYPYVESLICQSGVVAEFSRKLRLETQKQTQITTPGTINLEFFFDFWVDPISVSLSIL